MARELVGLDPSGACARAAARPCVPAAVPLPLATGAAVPSAVGGCDCTDVVGWLATAGAAAAAVPAEGAAAFLGSEVRRCSTAVASEDMQPPMVSRRIDQAKSRACRVV